MPRFNLDDYEPVEDRLAKFWSDHPLGRVTTELVHHDGSTFILKAFLFRDGQDVPFATGYAEEVIGSTNVNKTSACENGETSAIGRALANGGYAAKGKRPSREEMEKVQRHERQDHGELDSPPGSEVKPQRHSRSVSSGGGTEDTRLATEKQVQMLRAKLRAKGVQTSQNGYLEDEAVEAEWKDAGFPKVDFDSFPFSKVNDALEFIEQLEPVNA